MKFFTKPSGFPLLALLCALALAASPAHADFWVGNSTAGTLQYFNSTTGAITQTINFNPNSTNGVNDTPAGIALDSSNNLWAADSTNNSLIEYAYNSNSKNWNTVPSVSPSIIPGGGSPEGIAIYSGSVYVVEQAPNSTTPNESVQQYNIGTGKWSTAVSTTEFNNISAAAHPQGIAINSSGSLFVTDVSYIYEYTFSNSSNSWSYTSTLNGASYAYGLAFDSQGNLFAASLNSGAILEYAYNKNNGEYNTSNSTVVSNADTPVGLAFDPTTGHLLDAVNGQNHPHQVVAYGLSGSPSAATGTYQTAYSPTPSNSELGWLAGFDVVTAPAPSGLVLFALGFGILGFMYCRKQRSDSWHPFVAA